MKTEIIINKNVHYLGILCKRGHDYNDTGKSVRHKLSKSCIMCGREDYYKHREKVLARNKTKRYRENDRKYREKKREEILLYKRTHPKVFSIPIPQAVIDERERYYQRERYHNKKKFNVKFRLNKRMSNGVRLSLKRGSVGKDGNSWINLVDYSFDQLKERLESTLPENANWQDFLDGRLDIDHIIPKKVFNFNSYKDIDFKRCWDLNNLQLLWAEENRSKCAKIDKDFQPCLCL